MTPYRNRQQDRIDVFCAFPDAIRDESLLRQYRRILSDDERRREERFHFTADRHRYLVTRALVRTTLSRCAPVAPEDWSFSANEYGKPQVANDASTIRGLMFSISHARNLVVLALAWHGRLGIDVETPYMGRSAMEVAGHFFAPIEVETLSAQPPELRSKRFVEYWTLKECYTKARGLGLSIPLDQFWFCLDGHSAVRLGVTPGLDDDASRWRFWQGRLLDYTVAVCVEASETSSMSLSFRQVVPLVSEQPIECESIRASEPAISTTGS